MAETPCGNVLGTVELLEAVLFYLDNKTLLLSQRVSKTFEATITGSTQLQQKLFFTSVAAGTSYRCLQEGCNDLICMGCSFDRTLGHVHQNPLFAYELDHIVVVNREATISVYTEGTFVLSAREQFRPAAAKLEHGSWRRMLPCQPAMRLNWEVFSELPEEHGSYGYSSATTGDRNTVEHLVERLWVKDGKQQECGAGVHLFYYTVRTPQDRNDERRCLCGSTVDNLRYGSVQ
ncbi:hypothetical protein LTR17_017458 [Elasticomyces elasticus]|nr:hypothetical protein LTR17_017458 [Elasticomyces elasticus]